MAFTYCESAWLCAAIALLPASIATPVVALIFISLIYDWVVYRMKGAADDMPAEVRRSDVGVEGLALVFGGSDGLQRVLGLASPLKATWSSTWLRRVSSRVRRSRRQSVRNHSLETPTATRE